MSFYRKKDSIVWRTGSLKSSLDDRPNNKTKGNVNEVNNKEVESEDIEKKTFFWGACEYQNGPKWT